MPPRRNDSSGYRINHEIRVPQIRLVGENIENQGVYSLPEAQKMAAAMELDLVEISAQADPPVCKIIDFQKFLYQQRKKQKEIKANTVKIEMKEIRFGPNTGEHDYAFKLKHAENFLKDGDKVKAYVFFRGREIMFKDQGEAMLARFANDLEEWSKVEMLPKLEGKRMNMILTPKPKK
ncbi:MAG: translation initiation factor IF-3 [Prevotellaceae bacterium]|nr:translation initiation factor IF-3 [Prevotellaceae bacterium]